VTEVAIRSNGSGAVAVAEPRVTAAVATLADWASELDAATDMAVKLCQTPFAPAHFRGKPTDAAAAILTGHELGLSPMASLRSIFMISGTPGMYAKAMLAVVQAQGHNVWVAEQSPDRVVVKGWRKGAPDHIHETTWDPARVVAAKLTSNAKYQENPQAMMVARGTAEICRQVASDALHGIPYAVEELEDMPLRVEASVAPRVTAAEILGTVSAPPPAEPVDEPQTADAGPRLITQAQQRKLHALFRDNDLADRDAGLLYVGAIIGHPVESTKDLTVTEAGTVIDSLETQRAEPPVDVEP